MMNKPDLKKLFASETNMLPDDSQIAELAKALIDKGAKLPDQPTVTDVLAAGILFANAIAKRREQESTPTPGALEARMKAVEANLSTITGEHANNLVAAEIERGTLNPHDAEAMASARTLARTDEAAFTKLFASMVPSRPGDNSRSAPASSIRGRVDDAFNRRGV